MMDIWIWPPHYVVLVCVHIFLTTLHRAVAVYPVISGYEPRRCPAYQYVTYDTDGGMRCRHCSVCNRGTGAISRCTPDKDTECRQCQPGTYNDQHGGECRSCSQCQPGTYFDQGCNHERDTKCMPCPKGHFSIGENMLACTPCTQCRQHEVLERKCTRTSDTVCGQCDVGYFREFGTGWCLPCFKCDNPRNHVVAECLHTVGMIKQKKICWPHTISEKKPTESEKETATATTSRIQTDAPSWAIASDSVDITKELASIAGYVIAILVVMLLLLFAAIAFVRKSGLTGCFIGTRDPPRPISIRTDIIRLEAATSLEQSVDSSGIDDSTEGRPETERRRASIDVTDVECTDQNKDKIYQYSSTPSNYLIKKRGYKRLIKMPSAFNRTSDLDDTEALLCYHSWPRNSSRSVESDDDICSGVSDVVVTTHALDSGNAGDPKTQRVILEGNGCHGQDTNINRQLIDHFKTM